MRQTMMALIVFVTTVVGLYVFNATFGAAFDQMYFTFNATQSSFGLPTQWASIATTSLGRWKMVYQSITVITISVGVWVILTIVGEHDYTRERY